MSSLNGAIARVEAQASHRDFVEAVEPDTVMMKITHARRLMKNGETFSSFFNTNSPTVITTSTVPDNKLNLLRWEKELEIVRETNPDYHIPADNAVYEDTMDLDEQLNAVEKCVEGTLWMNEKINDQNIDVDLIPLVKGLTQKQRKAAYSLLDEIETDWQAFYAAQYFTANGVQISELLADVEQIVAETDKKLLLIGLLSPHTAEKLPVDVGAIAGQSRWRRKVKPQKQSDKQMSYQYEELSEDVLTALNHNPH